MKLYYKNQTKAHQHNDDICSGGQRQASRYVQLVYTNHNEPLGYEQAPVLWKD